MIPTLRRSSLYTSVESPSFQQGCRNPVPWTVARQLCKRLIQAICPLADSHPLPPTGGGGRGKNPLPHPKAFRRDCPVFFAPLRTLRETSFSNNNGKTSCPTGYSYSNGLVYNDERRSVGTIYSCLNDGVLTKMRIAGKSARKWIESEKIC